MIFSLSSFSDLVVFSEDTRPRLVSIRFLTPASRISSTCSATRL